jgi:hypothetical protein
MALLCCVNNCTQGKRCGRQFVVPPQAWPLEPEPGARALALATAQEEARWGIHSSTAASSTAAAAAAAATTRIHAATTVHSSSNSSSKCNRCCDDANSDSTGACSSTSSSSSSSSGSSKERDWEGEGGGWADSNCQSSNGSSSNGHGANGHCEQQCEVSYWVC